MCKRSLFFIILFLNVIVYGQTPVDTKSSLRKATVFPQGAQLEHECSVTLSEGQSLIRLVGLSPFVRPETIRVDGDGSFTILNVQHRLDYLNDVANSNEVKSIKEKLESLKTKSEEEETRLKIARDKFEFFTANRTFSGKDKSPDIESFKSFYAIYGSNVESLSLEILKRQHELNDFQKQIEKLNNQLNTLINKVNLPSGSILVLIDSKQAKTARLSFNYLVDNASWTPAYDVRFSGSDKPLLISSKAIIKQNTGIDWKDIRLVLSTAKTNISAQIPEFRPWYLGYYTPVLKGTMLMQEVQVAEMAEAPRQAGYSDEKKDVSVPEMSVDQRITYNEYSLELPQTIPSGDDNNIVKYRESKVDAFFEYEALPRQSQNVYLVGKIPEWYKADLSNGELNVYLENSYVGKSAVNTLQFSDTLSLSFGIDNNISILRKKMTDISGNQLIGSSRKETKGFRITCRNNKNQPVTVKISDQIPVSTRKDIEVEALELTGGIADQETGKVTWKASLNSLETKEFILKYSIKYPKNQRVITE